MEKLLYRKTSTNHYFGVESWPVAKEDSSIRTLSEEVSCWKDLEFINKSSKMPKKRYSLLLFNRDDAISNLPRSLKSKSHCDSKSKESSQETMQESLITKKKEKQERKRMKEREKCWKNAGFSIFSFQYWMLLKVTYAI